MMEPVKILTGEQAIAAFHALSDASRRRILHALRARRMTTSELVDFLATQEPDKEPKPQTVRYHLKELERCGLIRQDGYEPAGNGDSHIMQKIWRATAESIFIATGDIVSPPTNIDRGIERSLDILNTMKQLGFAIPSTQEIEHIIQNFTEWGHLWMLGRKQALDVLTSIAEIDPEIFVTLRRILSIILLPDNEYERYWEVSRLVSDALRKMYRSGHGANPEVY